MFGLEQLLKVLDPEPVLINRESCLRDRHVRSACRACSDICPKSAIDFTNRKLTIDSTVCNRCALCLGACPTAALQVRGFNESLLEGAATVRCAHTAGEGVLLPCLGALSVDHLVDLGSRQPGVVLLAADCSACALSAGGAKAKERLVKAASMLTTLGVTESPQWHTYEASTVTANQPSVSRRELFSLWSQGVSLTGRNLLPDREANPVKLPTKVPARRLRWFKRFSASDQGERLNWPTRQVTPSCYGCNICVSFCPTGALASHSAENRWVLSFQAAACVDCRTCIDLCPRNAMIEGDPPTVGEVVSGTRRDLADLGPAERNLPKIYGGLGPRDLG